MASQTFSRITPNYSHMNSKTLLTCRIVLVWLVLEEADGWGLVEFKLLYQNWSYLYLDGKLLRNLTSYLMNSAESLMPGNRGFDVEMSIENI